MKHCKTILVLSSLLTTFSRAHAQRVPAGASVHIPNQQPGRIRGVAFDSVLMKPVPHATVTLFATSRTTTADEKGQFAFTDVDAGEQ